MSREQDRATNIATARWLNIRNMRAMAASGTWAPTYCMSCGREHETARDFEEKHVAFVGGSK